jgi:predicted site-specific integrase-resolvase
VTKLYLAQIPKHFTVSRGTIYRDIRQGKLSAENNGKGRTVVDLSELERVYKRKREGEMSHIVQRVQSDTDDSVHDSSVLRREVELLREQITGHVGVISDLRSERGRLLKLLEEQASSVKLLTDERMRQKHPRRWWPWRRP